jgi:hypothetical protein
MLSRGRRSAALTGLPDRELPSWIHPLKT